MTVPFCPTKPRKRDSLLLPVFRREHEKLDGESWRSKKAEQERDSLFLPVPAHAEPADNAWLDVSSQPRINWRQPRTSAGSTEDKRVLFVGSRLEVEDDPAAKAARRRMEIGH